MTDLERQLNQLEEVSRRLEWVGEDAERRLGLAVEAACRFLDGISEAPAWRTPGVPPVRQADPPVEPTPLADVIAEFEDVIEDGVNPVSGRFFGYVPGGAVPTAAVGDLLAAVNNRYSGVYGACPGAATLENDALRWIRDALGLPSSAWGTFTSGGTLASLTGLIAARSTRPLASWPTSVIYHTDEIHGCFAKSLRSAALDHCVLRQVPVDDEHRMRVDALADMVRSDRADGLSPWIVGASAGTVNTGAVDPLGALADLVRREGLWLHVDAAYGGLFGLTAVAGSQLEGMKRADSLVLDPHKGLFQPYGCGAVFVRDPDRLRDAMSYRADYLADAESDSEPSPADYSLELTRHFRGARVWFTLKTHGLDRLCAALEEKLLLARYAHGQLATVDGLEVGPAPQLSIVVFRVAGDGDQSTAHLLTHLLESSGIHLSSTRIDGQLWLRVCVLCFRSHREHIDELVQFLRTRRPVDRGVGASR